MASEWLLVVGQEEVWSGGLSLGHDGGALSGYEQEGGGDKQRMNRVSLGVSTDRSRSVVGDSP